MRLNNIRKIFLVGDIHLGIKNNSVEWIQIQKEFLLNFLINKVDEDFDENRDILIFEGDIFHSRESINVRVQNEAFEIFEILANKFKRGVYIILGNHDVYYKDNNEVNSLKSISHLSENIIIFEKPEILIINGKHNFLMLPWVENAQELSSIVSKHIGLCEYIICHADIKGASFDKWTKVEHGLDVKVIESYSRVWAGHIHRRQSFKNVVYTGTPYQMDRGDIGNDKGFYVLGVDGQLTEEFVPNTFSPVFTKYDAYDLMELSPIEIENLFKNSFVDIMISIKLVNNFSVSRFLDLISKSTHRKVEFFTYVDQDPESTQQVDFNPEDHLNTIDIFKSYLKTKDYTQSFKIELAKKFLEIHNSVKSNSVYD